MTIMNLRMVSMVLRLKRIFGMVSKECRRYNPYYIMSFELIPWQTIIIWGTLFTSFGQIFNKYQVSRATSLQVNFYKYSFSLILALIFWKLSGLVWPEQWLILLVYGIMGGLSVTLYTKASRYSLSKTVLVIPISQVLEVVMASIIFNEWKRVFVNDHQMILTLMLVPMLVWLFYEKGGDSKKWSLLIIVIIIYLAGLNLFAKHYLNQVEPLQLLLLQYIGSVLVISFGLQVKKNKFYLGGKFALMGFLQSIFTMTGVWLYYVGLQKTTISQTTLLRMPIFLIMTTLFGLFIFREVKSMTVKKWLGVMVALVIAVLAMTINH